MYYNVLMNFDIFIIMLVECNSECRFKLSNCNAPVTLSRLHWRSSTNAGDMCNTENKKAPEVDNLLNNEPINTVQIAKDGEPSRTKNNELEPIQIRTG